MNQDLEAGPRRRGPADLGSRIALKTLLITDLVGSTRVVEELGDKRAGEVWAHHDRLVRDLLAGFGGLEIDKTDGFLLLFERPVDAVRFAVEYHQKLSTLGHQGGIDLRTRSGIHLGEVVLRENPPADVARGAKLLEVEGLAKSIAARLMSLAIGGQTLLTRGAFDLARRGAVGEFTDRERLRWLAHGEYRMKGVEETVEIFEVGVEGIAPLAPPPDSTKVRRSTQADTVLGWRPAAGLTVPRRSHWVLESKVGHGAAGEVWLAAHRKTHNQRVFKFCTDPVRLRSLRREVMLFRLLKEELGTRDDITRILDWNFEEVPYFIEFDYSEGGNLIEWAESQGGLDQVSLSTRLEIVSQVAEALAAAHSVGVLHKDVKPGNILVTSDKEGNPRAQVTDFGIAQTIDPQRFASAEITDLGLTDMPIDTGSSSYEGTRLYVAPELLQGGTATLQSDVYALGVVLYQAVIGDFSRALAPGWERDVEDAILREDISFAADGDPQQRLGNALRLAQRLQALPSRRLERQAEQRAAEATERFRRRRKWLSSITVALAILAGIMTLQTRRITNEAERANQAAAKAAQVSTFLSGLFEVAAPTRSKGEQVTARQLLDQGALRIEEELADQSPLQASMMTLMGNIYRELALFEEARLLLEQAVALRREQPGPFRLELAESLHGLARLREEEGEHAAAQALYKEVLAIRELVLDPDDAEVARTLGGLGRVLELQGAFGQAHRYHEQALATFEAALGPDHHEVGHTLLSLGGLNMRIREFEHAKVLISRALKIFNRRYGDDHPYVADTRVLLASALRFTGDSTAARAQYEQALPSLEQAYGAMHPAVALALDRLGSLLNAMREREAAIPHHERALAIREAAFGPSHPLVAASLNNLGLSHWGNKNLVTARQCFERSVTVYEETLGPDHVDIAVPLRNLGEVLQISGELIAAKTLYERVLKIRERALGQEHSLLARPLFNLGKLQMALDDPAAAEPLLRRALILGRDREPHRHPEIIWPRISLGECLTAQNRFPEAETLLRQTFAEEGVSRFALRRAREALVALYQAWDRPRKAELERRALETLE